MEIMGDMYNQNPGSNPGSGTMETGNSGREYPGNRLAGESNAGQLIRDNQEEGRYTSLFEEGTSDWQDRSTGSMGSQTSGGITSGKMNAREDESDSGRDIQQGNNNEHWNRYGQSAQDIQHAKDNEQMIRKGYSETQQTDTNPYLKDIYSSSTKEQLSGKEESIQQMENRPGPAAEQQQQQSPELNQQAYRTSADRYQNQRVTEEGRNEEIGGPMDASKNY